MLDLLVSNATIITMAGGKAGTIQRGSVGIEGDSIACVGEAGAIAEKYSARRTIDAEGKLVMPGFVNAHTHSTTGLGKGILVGLKYYLEQGLAGYNEGITRESQTASSKMHILEGIKRGYTTYCDTNFGSSVIAKVHEQFGTRARISELVREMPWDYRDLVGQVYTFDRRYAEPNVQASHELLEKYGTDPNSRISAMVAFQGLDYCSEKLILELRDLARSKNAMIHTHVAQSYFEVDQCVKRWGKTPVCVLEEMGMLNCNTIGAHMTCHQNEDTELAAASGVGLLATPTSYSFSGKISPVAQYIHAGGRAAIGSDECAYSCVNPMVAMRVALSCSNIGARLAGVPALKVFQMLQMATIGAAEIIGLGDQVGSLEVGKKADIIILNPKTLSMLPFLLDPLINYVNNLVTSATGDEVETVIIDGKLVMEERKVLTVDEQEVFAEIQYEGQKAAEKAYRYFKTLPDSEVIALQSDFHR